MTIKNPDLQNSFDARADGRVQIDYTADPSALVADLRARLQGSALARRLIAMSDAQGVGVRGLKGPRESVYVPEHKWVFITVTPHTRANAKLALLYAGALREAEQNILGFARPGAAVDDDTWVTTNLVKNLDIIKNMCQIVQEISVLNQEDSEFLDSLTKLGHDQIYKAFVNQSSDEDLIRLLAKQEQLEIREGE